MATVHDEVHQVVTSLESVPSDILLQIFSYLDADDVVVMSQLSHFLHEFANTYIIWHNVLLSLLHRARYIDLLSLDKKPLRSADVLELKKSVIKASHADKNWLSSHPKALGPPRIIKLQENDTVHDISLDQVAYITKFTSRHLMIPLNNGGILGWDLEKNNSAGKHIMNNNAVLMDIALDKETNSFIALLGVVAPVRRDGSFGIHIRMTVLRISIPLNETEGPLCFTELAKLTVLVPFTSEVHLLDASRKMLCVVYKNEESETLRILLIHNWETEECSLIDTNVPYVYGRSLIGLHLSDDGENLILVSEEKGREIRRFLHIKGLKSFTELWNVLDNSSRAVVPPTTGRIFDWKNEIQDLQDDELFRPYLFWQLDQIPSPPSKSIPGRVSTMVLYVSSNDNEMEEREEDGFVILDLPKRTWSIAQYYSDQDGPCSSSRNFATIRDPALNTEPIEVGDQLVPMMCLSFNHFGWIQEVVDELDKHKKSRVLKLLTFPDPGCTYIGDLADTAKTLDIPSDVLDDANHILIDATQGLIMVATNSKTLQAYYY